jgi:hypothetical protein
VAKHTRGERATTTRLQHRVEPARRRRRRSVIVGRRRRSERRQPVLEREDAGARSAVTLQVGLRTPSIRARRVAARPTWNEKKPVRGLLYAFSAQKGAAGANASHAHPPRP